MLFCSSSNRQGQADSICQALLICSLVLLHMADCIPIAICPLHFFVSSSLFLLFHLFSCFYIYLSIQIFISHEALVTSNATSIVLQQWMDCHMHNYLYNSTSIPPLFPLLSLLLSPVSLPLPPPLLLLLFFYSSKDTSCGAIPPRHHYRHLVQAQYVAQSIHGVILFIFFSFDFDLYVCWKNAVCKLAKSSFSGSSKTSS